MRGVGGSVEAARAAGREAAGVGKLAARFGDDERGVAAIFFGIMFAVLLLGVAIAVDFSRATHEKSREQLALDAAVLAASSRLGLPDQDTTGPAVAEKFFHENLRHGSPAQIDHLTMNAEEGSVEATSNSIMPTTLMKAFKKYTMNVGAASKVVKGQGTIEVAMVLDNSGSMCQPCTKIDNLKTAAKNLVGVIFAGVQTPGDVKVGLVPFAASVNVGAGNQNSAWMDGSYQSSIHSENFVSAKSRFDLFSDLGVNWGGCVESRPGALDTNDTPASSGTPDSQFVPMFAPDEPDDPNNGGSTYYNNYAIDDGGTCARQTCTCTSVSRRGNCQRWQLTAATPAVAQARVCKYQVASTNITDNCSRGAHSGSPNYMCTSRPIMPLSETKTEIDTAIDDLQATGNTNIGEGTMWGWRVLSPSEPFSGGRSYTDAENKKVMIVMTDGVNTYGAASNHNQSRYGASGYASKGRLGTTYTTNAYVARMNTKLTAACTAAKAQNITVYTVAFDTEGGGIDATTRTLLTQCASSSDKYYLASDGNALIQAFQTIGREISKLRVSS